MKKVITVVGARPQIVKAGIVAHAMRDVAPLPFEHLLVHTGQHYDDLMSDVFFREFDIEPPSVNLGVGSHPAAAQTALMLERLDGVIAAESPDLVLVYGDTNSTLAAALAAGGRDVPLIHVEAGERIYRRKQVPEESNRVLADNAATLCLTCTARATDNLRWEGFASERVRFVGDPMFDLFLWGKDRVDTAAQLSPGSFGLTAGNYHLATIHRRENTSSADDLRSLLNGLDESRLPVLLPVHPRVRVMLDVLNWEPSRNLRLVDPLGYFDFLRLLLDCRRVATDSGGVIREAYFAGKPCVVPMENNWWSEIVEAGWAIEVGADREALREALDTYEPGTSPPLGLFGDGRASHRIVEQVSEMVSASPSSDGPWHHHGRFEGLPAVAPSKFTINNYRELLGRFLEQGYRFVSFHDIDDESDLDRGVVLLRHDIDIDTGPALQLAELEHEMGVQATYLFMLRNDFYNVLAPRNHDAIQRILELGHFLGLHFDCSAYPGMSSVQEVAEATKREVALLESWLNRPVEMVSYHRPSQMVLNGDPELSSPLPHTYMKRFTQRIRYMSDSRGAWREGDPTESEHFFARRSFQVLVHPIWWGDRPTSPYHRLERFARTAQDRIELALAENSLVYRVGPWVGVSDR